MGKALRFLATVACLMLVASVWADARVTLYDGTTLRSTPASWGHGKAAQSEKVRFLGKRALEVESRGLYEGARLDLVRSFDLSPFLENPEGSYLVMIVQVPKAAAAKAALRGTPGMPGAQGPMGGGMMGPGMMMPPGGMPQGGMGEGMMMPPGGMPQGGAPQQGGMMGPGMMMPPGGMPQGGAMQPGMPGMPGMPGAQGQGGQGVQGGMGPMGPGMMMPPGGMAGGGMMGAGMPGVPGGGPMPPGEMAGPMGPGGAMGPGGMLGPAGMMGPGGMMGGKTRAPEKEIDTVRAVFVTDQGLIDCGVAKIDKTAVDAEGWLRVLLPVAQFRGKGKVAEAKVEKVAFFGNQTGKFYIGRAWFVEEDTPLIADAGPSQRRVKVGQRVKFEAAPQQGDLRARYTWDFDDLDGVTEDAIGPEATWTFEQEGYYVVTLTVKDLSGSLVPKVDHVYVLAEK